MTNLQDSISMNTSLAQPLSLPPSSKEPINVEPNDLTPSPNNFNKSNKPNPFKEVFKKHKTSIILSIVLFLSTLSWLTWNQYSNYKNLNNQVSLISEAYTNQQQALLLDYASYRALPFSTNLNPPLELLKKHQHQALAYILFSERIVSLMYQSKINLGSNKIITVTPAQKLAAKKAGQEILERYNKNKGSFTLTSIQLKAVNAQYPTLWTNKMYAQAHQDIEKAELAMDSKLKQVLSRFDSSHYNTWQAYYLEVDTYMKNQKNSTPPKPPVLSL